MKDAFEKELYEAAGQRTEVWRDARCGKFTSSEIWKLMTEPRSKSKKWSEVAMTYIRSKVAEEVSGVVHQPSNAYPLVWGEENEPLAREAFVKMTGMKVDVPGFIMMNDYYGGSPDGIVADQNSIIEIKCPFNPANHVEYLLAEAITEENFREYYWQMQSNMLITHTTRCYFIAFDPRFDDPYRLKIIEVPYDSSAAERMLQRITDAVAEKLNMLNKLSYGKERKKTDC